MLATNTTFIDFLRIILPKLHVKSKPHPLKICWAKVEKVQKMQNLCIILLIDLSRCNFLEKLFLISK